jgi:hypothetical protein
MNAEGIIVNEDEIDDYSSASTSHLEILNNQ